MTIKQEIKALQDEIARDKEKTLPLQDLLET